MSIIVTRIVVAPDGSVSLAESLPPGEHVARIEVEDAAKREAPPFDFEALPQFDIGPSPAGARFGRDEIYGDDGR